MDDPDHLDDPAWSELPEELRLALLEIARRELGGELQLTCREVSDVSGIPRSTISLVERTALIKLRRQAERLGF